MTSDKERREVAARMREKMYLLSESDLREISDEYNADYNKPLMEWAESPILVMTDPWDNCNVCNLYVCPKCGRTTVIVMERAVDDE